jgi:hypothetical protein
VVVVRLALVVVLAWIVVRLPRRQAAEETGVRAMSYGVRRFEGGRPVGDQRFDYDPEWDGPRRAGSRKVDAAPVAVPEPSPAPALAAPVPPVVHIKKHRTVVLPPAAPAPVEPPVPVFVPAPAPQPAPVPTPVPVPAPPPAPAAAMRPITDTAGMRGFLIQQMQLAATGAIDTERVKNVCALAQQVYHATKLELDAARILKDTDRSIRAIDLTNEDSA